MVLLWRIISYTKLFNNSLVFVIQWKGITDNMSNFLIMAKVLVEGI